MPPGSTRATSSMYRGHDATRPSGNRRVRPSKQTLRQRPQTPMTPPPRMALSVSFAIAPAVGSSALGWPRDAAGDEPATRRPNIVLIVSDDQGYGDSTAY